MNTRATIKQWSLLTAGLCLVITSCKKKMDEVPPANNPDYSGYVVGLRAQTGASTEADYILSHQDLMSGTISSAGQGLEQTGWCYYGYFGGKFFTFNYDLNECIGYNMKPKTGQLEENGKFIFERMDCINKINGSNSEFVAIGAPWGGGSFDCQIQIVDVNDVSIHKNVKTTIYVSKDSTGNQQNAWPTYCWVRNGKMYISFYPLDGVSWKTQNVDTAYVSVYSYPGLVYQKTFKDTRTGPVGYYASQPSVLETENGDLYTFSSSSYLAGFTKATKPSGILRIKNGEEQFDPNYFFNVEALGYKVLCGAYTGNGKAVARVSVLADETMANQWGAFYSPAPYFRLVVIDLINKTVVPVSGVPNHTGQYQTPIFVKDGKAHFSINNMTEAYVYSVDPTTATGTKGAKIQGNELQGIFKVN